MTGDSRPRGPFMCSFNFEDVADLLGRVAEIVKPGPVALQEHGGKRG